MKSIEPRLCSDAASLDMAFLVFDQEGRIRDVNPAASERLQYSRSELRHLTIITVAPGLVVSELRAALDDSPDHSLQWSGMLQGRTGEPFAVRGRVLRLLENTDALFVVLFPVARSGVDASLPPLESMYRWADDLAHRLNNFLTIIQVHASYLLAEEKLGPDATDSVREIYLAVNRAAELTAQLARVNRPPISD